MLDKMVFEKEIHLGSLVKIVDGQRIYEVTDIWIDKHFVTWLRLDNHYIYASYDVRPTHD